MRILSKGEFLKKQTGNHNLYRTTKFLIRNKNKQTNKQTNTHTPGYQRQTYFFKFFQVLL
jgi:hypothetical protein